MYLCIRLTTGPNSGTYTSKLPSIVSKYPDLTEFNFIFIISAYTEMFTVYTVKENPPHHQQLGTPLTSTSPVEGIATLCLLIPGRYQRTSLPQQYFQRCNQPLRLLLAYCSRNVRFHCANLRAQISPSLDVYVDDIISSIEPNTCHYQVIVKYQPFVNPPAHYITADNRRVQKVPISAHACNPLRLASGRNLHLLYLLRPASLSANNSVYKHRLAFDQNLVFWRARCGLRQCILA